MKEDELIIFSELINLIYMNFKLDLVKSDKVHCFVIKAVNSGTL